MCFGSERFSKQRTETGNTKTCYSSAVTRQVVCSFETSVYLHQSKGRHIPANCSRLVHTITNMLQSVNGTYMLLDFILSFISQ